MKKNEKRGSTTPTTQSQKAAYISINLGAEMAALEKLGFRERWAYLCCKRKANFKTGTVGKFGNQKLVYGDIAAMVIAPATQGRGQGAIDETQAKDFLERMQEVGLVADIGRRPNGGLVFELPLSPIKPAPAKPVDRKMPDIFLPEGLPQMAENLGPAWDCDDWTPSVSVMINKELNINTDEAAFGTADAASGRAAGAAPVRENPPAVAAVAAPRLTAEQIREAVADNFQIQDSMTPEALALYETWANAGISLDDLQCAMTSAEEDASCPNPTPADITPRLFPEMFST